MVAWEAAVDKEMEGYARDCVRLAGMTDDPEMRESLMKMAREWMEAAVGEHRERTEPAPNVRAALGVASTFAHPCAGEGEAHVGPRQGLAWFWSSIPLGTAMISMT
jgi:hypothetical protein